MKAVFSVAILGVAAGLVSGQVLAGEEREITREWPVADLETIEIDANVGSVRLVGSDRDTISLVLRIEPDNDWGSRDRAREIIEAAELEERLSSSTLALDLKTERTNDGDDIEERWALEIPQQLMAVIELNVGEVDIEGTSGGVEAEVNVGELDIEVLSGSIDAEVNVGDLSITSATESPGAFDLEVNIGNVDLEIDGEDAGVDRGWLGGSIRHDAGGEDDVDAVVNVGDLDVDID